MEINNGWINVKDNLPQSGQEVLIYYFDKGYDIHQIYIVTYFKKDAIMDTVINNAYDTPEEKLLDVLFNKENEIKAPEDGFYIYDSAEDRFYIYDSVNEKSRYRKHANVITHWQPLPEPPCM